MNTLQFLEAVKARQSRILDCATCETPMSHEWTAGGWVCSCGDVVALEDVSDWNIGGEIIKGRSDWFDDTLGGSLTNAGYGSSGIA